jgi:hypothetical protein
MICGRGKAATAMRIVCAIVLLFLGLGHQAPTSVSANANVALYLLPDGSLPMLCTTGAADDGKFALKAGCEVCRLASSTMLPEPDDGRWLAIEGVFLVSPLETADGLPAVRKTRRANSRAPPVEV